MGQKQKIVILGSVLGILVVVFIFGTVFKPDRKFTNIYEVKLLSRIEKNVIHSVELQKENTSQVLRKNQGIWNVLIDGNPFPADRKKVDEFLLKLLELETKRFVTENEERYKDFNLGPDENKIVLYDESRNVLEEILVSTGENNQMEYVTTSGSAKVFAVENIFSFYINQDGPFWSDLTVFPDNLKDKEIIRIDIYADNLQLKIEEDPISVDYSIYKTTSENGNPIWKVEGNEDRALQGGNVTSIINAFTGLRAERFSTKKRVDSGVYTAIAAVTTGDNEEYRLMVQQALDESSYECTINKKEYTYVLKNWNLERIFKPLGALSTP